MKTNLILTADAYTISSGSFVSNKAKEKSVYNLTNRYSPANVLPELCKDSRMVMYGLSYFISKHLTTKITHEDVSEAKYFMRRAHSFGGAMAFDECLWRRVVDEYGGYLPIDISGIAEGLTFFPNQPFIQVESDEGFGEIAAHIEALMVGYVSIATARVTMARHWLERFYDYFRLEGIKEADLYKYGKWMIHDFGMRASSCGEESELLGLAHLLVFNGTDTFNAARMAKQLGANAETGTSIHALAHRIVQGYDSEIDCFNAIEKINSEVCDVNIASYVADCYNYDNALKVLAQKAKDNPNIIYVVRPDSGPYVENVLKVCEYGLPNLRFIQGDSMNPEKVDETVKAMHSAGYKLHNTGIFGVGGWLRNTSTRDLFSSAYKLSAKGRDYEPVVKLSEVRGKMSVPGPNSLLQINENDTKIKPTVYIGHHTVCPNAYQTYFRNFKCGNRIKDTPFVANEIKFDKIKNTALSHFNSLGKFAKEFPEYGTTDDVFCDSIRKIRDCAYTLYRQ